MTRRLEKLTEEVKDDFIRGFLAAADSKDSPASMYTLAALETLAERVVALEKAAEKGGSEK